MKLFSRLFAVGIFIALTCVTTTLQMSAQGKVWKFQQTFEFLTFENADSILAINPWMRMDPALRASIYADSIPMQDTFNLFTLSSSNPKVHRHSNTLFMSASLTYAPKKIINNTNMIAVILASKDSGRTWRNIDLPRSIPDTMITVSFVTEITSVTDSILIAGVAVVRTNLATPTMNDRMYRSTNAGATWASIPTSSIDTIMDYEHISFSRDGKLGMACERSGFKNSYSTTLDSGKTWNVQLVPFNEISRRKLRVLDSTTALRFQSFIFRPFESIGTRLMRTTDKGASWFNVGFPVNGFASVDSSNEFEWRDLEFIDSKNGIGTLYRTRSAENIIVRTTNGGLSWDIVDRDSVFKRRAVAKWRAIQYSSHREIYVVNDAGYVKYSNDSGKTWRVLIDDVPGDDDLVQFGLSSFYAVDTNTIICSFTPNNYVTNNHYGETIYTMVNDTTSTSVEHVETVLNNDQMVWIEDFAPHPASSEVSARVFIDPRYNLDATRFDVFNSVGGLVSSNTGNMLSLTGDAWGNGWMRVRIPLVNMPDGLYFLRYSAGERTMSKPFLLVR